MKIFKISQNEESLPFPVWLAQELSQNTYLLYSSYIKLLQKWVNETNPNLNNYDLDKAYRKAKDHYLESPASDVTNITEENKKDMAEILDSYYHKINESVNSDTIKLIEINPIYQKSQDPYVTYTNNNPKSFQIKIKYKCPLIKIERQANFITKDGKVLIFQKLD